MLVTGLIWEERASGSNPVSGNFSGFIPLGGLRMAVRRTISVRILTRGLTCLFILRNGLMNRVRHRKYLLFDYYLRAGVAYAYGDGELSFPYDAEVIFWREMFTQWETFRHGFLLGNHRQVSSFVLF